MRALRLASGLVLFAWLLAHSLNHALGLFGVAAMEAMLRAIYPAIASPAGTALLGGALLVHVALALVALWRRRSLRLPPAEAAQYALGFLVPLLLARHLALTRIAEQAHGLDFGHYRVQLLILGADGAAEGVAQAVLLLAAWAHACLGLRFWLRSKRWYERAQPPLAAGVVLVPALALAGALAGWRDLVAERALAAALGRAVAPLPVPPAVTEWDAWTLRGAVLAALGAVLLGRALRQARERRAGLVRLTYPGGRVVAVPPGLSVLEASRLHGIPHASVCGGRGRCSTCRVRVRCDDPSICGPPGSDEARVLARIGAAPDVRLACQLRPRAGALSVTPLLDPGLPAAALLREREAPQGEEREIVVLFADLRDFTRLAESRLPYDVVHLLNRYFAATGAAVEAAGGRVDKFLGDGVMALFGAEGAAGEDAVRAACRAGLDAARRIGLAVEALNREAEVELGAHLRIGIALHAGPAIVGVMGHGRAAGLTAIGDTVNTASRLEAACKEFGCELVVSEAVLERAGRAQAVGGERHEIALRGRSERLAVRAVKRAGEMA